MQLKEDNYRLIEVYLLFTKNWLIVLITLQLHYLLPPPPPQIARLQGWRKSPELATFAHSSPTYQSCGRKHCSQSFLRFGIKCARNGKEIVLLICENLLSNLMNEFVFSFHCRKANLTSKQCSKRRNT